ncbi:lysophospholipase L1-like esterase [Paenibacillus cellulosilyticus]|uniref:Lysophospholipase L1-like esterase n=1 Tax=Paenibacillus cellulosilyticus TaxID=375489 RepID=A0A2V2Z0Z5_9BACL|nr:SGNH/GDSL hydrolase family protein [Paenibacillus cellulosilyticus]PWW08527.1 lysophospholipase L1-like esterase [Paenibacillus cellulosilyticus]QKS48106.1 SGNH/GDSL hydrolase family protein [Paenibacillus cellulosilyticus]
MSTSKWAGKKAVFLGDSITEGVGTAKTYHAFLNEMIGFGHLLHYGISGTRIASRPDDGGSAMSVRYTGMADEADLVVVFGGTNDFGHGTAPIGTTEDFATDTYLGALNVLMTGLIEKYPAASICFLTPLHRDFYDGYGELNPETGLTLTQFAEHLKERARYYALPVLDLYAMSGMQPKLQIIKDRYMPDGLHPNEAGHRLMAQRIAPFLETL